MTKSKDTGVHGLAVINKPAGWTSHDVVAKCRAICKQPRCGHSGTLDPDATGVLLLGFGKVTKLLSLLTALPKSYAGEVVLGTSTSTLDAAGTVTGTFDMSGVTIDDVRRVASSLTGDLMQIPPMVSAVQIGGKRLHELARQGIEVDRPPRPVHVSRYDVIAEVAPGVFRVEIDCSSGTYVRVLAADVGSALGGGAHLRNLVRTGIGAFRVEQALPLDRFAVFDVETARSMLLPPAEALVGFTKVHVAAALVNAVRNGAILDRTELGSPDGDGPWPVLGPKGDLLAVYEVHDATRLKPAVVLPD
jgi:tRNA pseudouridine55 synthase